MNDTDRPDPLAPPPGYGQRRASGPPELLAGYDPVDTLCDWRDGPERSVGRCGQPRTWVLTMGDVNEHIVTADTCDKHGIVAANAPMHYCTVCTEVTGHNVPMELIRRQHVRPDGSLEDRPLTDNRMASRAQEGIDSLHARGWQDHDTRNGGSR